MRRTRVYTSAAMRLSIGFRRLATQDKDARAGHLYRREYLVPSWNYERVPLDMADWKRSTDPG